MSAESCVLSVVLPTLNEAENIPVLVERLDALLKDIPHEIIVADDDSLDGTWKVAEGLRGRFPQLRVLRRTKDKGLYPAVIEGFESAAGRYFVVMDTDLQHDETLVPKLLKAAREDGAGLAIGCRYMEGGSSAGLSGPFRSILSRGGTWLAGLILPRRIKDPMSGFFLIDRKLYEKIRSRLRPKGFKILLDIVANLPAETKVAELPFVFRERHAGKSKLKGVVIWEALRALIETYRRRSAR